MDMPLPSPGRIDAIVPILSHTPPWVFGLFVGLLALGLMQARPRRVGRTPALLLPAGMIVLSLAGIQSSFGLAAGPLGWWAVAMGLSTSLGYSMFRDRRVAFDATAKQFLVPGRWTPLAVIMAIFFTKYAFAVMRALDAGVISSPAFAASLSGVYGMLSGYFAARAVNLVVTARRASHQRNFGTLPAAGG